MTDNVKNARIPFPEERNILARLHGVFAAQPLLRGAKITIQKDGWPVAVYLAESPAGATEPTERLDPRCLTLDGAPIIREQYAEGKRLYFSLTDDCYDLLMRTAWTLPVMDAPAQPSLAQKAIERLALHARVYPETHAACPRRREAQDTLLSAWKIIGAKGRPTLIRHWLDISAAQTLALFRLVPPRERRAWRRELTGLCKALAALLSWGVYWREEGLLPPALE